MSLFFLDVNVWLALSDPDHIHGSDARTWLKTVPQDRIVVFSRFTQIGLLRLLTNEPVMKDRTMTLRKAWEVTTGGFRTRGSSSMPSRTIWKRRSAR